MLKGQNLINFFISKRINLKKHLRLWLAFKLLVSKKVLFGGSAPLSVFGLVLGVAALVSSMAVMSGFEETLKNAMGDVTGHVQVVRRGRLVDNWPEFSRKLKQTEPDIKHMMRFGYAEAVLAKSGKVSGVLFQGVEGEQFSKVLNLNPRVKEGTLKIAPADLAIGVGLAHKFNIKSGDKVHLVVPIATPFETSGFKRQAKEFVITAIIDFGKNDWNERLVVGDLHDLQVLTQIGDRYTGAFIKLNDINKAQEASTKISNSLGSNYSVMDWYSINRNLFEAVAIERIVIFFVVLIIVIVAVFNIASTLYIFIRQRFSDIAILKTLGLNQKDILKIFMGQGFFVGLIGTVLGIILGFILCFGFMYLQHRYGIISGAVYKVDSIIVQVRFVDLLIITLTTVGLCLLATYTPAKKGSQLEVMEGLKND